MTGKNKKEIRVLLGKHLQQHRKEVLKIEFLRRLAIQHDYDVSKLTKIEKGQLDIRFETLVNLALIYGLSLKELMNFEVPFWPETRRQKKLKPRNLA